MALLKICHYGDPVLEKVAKEVEVVDDDVRLFLDDMVKTMRSAEGIGLAAPQVGVSKRLVVVEIEGRVYKLVNPVIVDKKGKCKDTEGCLSVPDINGDVERAQFVKMMYLDENGEKQVIEADGLLARCFQHEIDHLDGILFIFKLGRATKFILKKRIAALKAETLTDLAAEQG
jgi:peptide deformylase